VTRIGLLLATLPLLAGCPIPQPLVEVSKNRVPPPRIINDSTLVPPDTIVPYDPSCPVPQSFSVSAVLGDDNTEDVDDYRWFVDYRPDLQSRWTPLLGDSLGPPTTAPLNLRPVPAFSFRPADFDSGAPSAHVLELVVSNGFAGGDQASLQRPYRTPDASHEVQAFRWVFVPSPGSGGCP
jgi:hypothetical protein